MSERDTLDPFASAESENGALNESLVDDIREEGATGIEREDPDDGAQLVQPFDPTLIRVSPRPLNLDVLITRLNEKEIDLNPGFQRKSGIWKNRAQSRLIESLLIRIPLPAFYFDATTEDRWLVVDGLQRLTAIKRFVIDQSLKLQELEFLTEHNGATYDDLPRSLQRRIREAQITAYLIEPGTPETVKFNIFKRINTGGLPLSPQEIRHALNQGKAADLLDRLAASAEFKRATNNGISDERMADRECVLRFLGFALTPYTEYKPQDLDTFLNAAMRQINLLPARELAQLSAQFRRVMQAAAEIFGRKAFRKQLPSTDRLFPISKALFEVWAIGLHNCTDQQLAALITRRGGVNDAFREIILHDQVFVNAITQGTGDVAKVKKRFETIEQLIAGVLK